MHSESYSDDIKDLGDVKEAKDASQEPEQKHFGDLRKQKEQSLPHDK